jgi:alkyl hydroperoxide reductase 1
MTDVGMAFCKSIGWANEAGDKALRFAIIIDHGKVLYAEKEVKPRTVEMSGAEAVLAKL